jgi:hypothetical protein
MRISEEESKANSLNLEYIKPMGNVQHHCDISTNFIFLTIYHSMQRIMAGGIRKACYYDLLDVTCYKNGRSSGSSLKIAAMCRM